ncbi:MAG TPA: tetratricopeptide repeat protein [Candidatus Deferrimicrobiaceae bacterium]
MSFLDSLKKIFSSREDENRASLSKKVQSAPNDPQARQKLGIFLMRQGEVVEGLDQLARSAVLYEKDGFATKAIAVLRQMLKHDPGNNDFQKWIIRLLAQEGLSADAQAELRKVAAEPGRFPSDEQRLDFFRQTAEYLPRNPLPRMYICDILRGQKKLLEAVNEMEKAAPSTVATGMYPEFGERLKALVAHSHNDPAVMEPCGFLWIAVGMLEEGISLLERVVAEVESSGDHERAGKMQEVLDAVRNGWDVLSARAVSFDEAMAKLSAPPEEEQAPPSQGGAQRPAVTVAEAQALQREGRYQEEETIVRSALGRLQAKVQEEIGDSDLEARYNLGIAYKEMGLLEEAVKEFRLAMGKPDLLVASASLLADTLSEQGDLSAAGEVLEEALAAETLSDGDRRDVRYHMAVLLSRQGREEEARGIFLSLYEEMPEYRDVKARTEPYRS